jgi:uncharacterized membrane protein (UPF0127 family)
MLKRLPIIVGAALVALALSGFWYSRTHAPEFDAEASKTVVFRSPDNNGISLQLEIAKTQEERSKGLMFRETLNEGHGMLFIFDTNQYLSFWMKNTLIPLDILFFNNAGKFVSRTSMEPCITSECPSYPSGGPATYAVEVPKGDSRAATIGSGWMMLIPN